ncbi:Calcium/calmodulin dependent protein kinase II association domain [Popillia japonica]|uniref:Calcium/calmodulin dependent protein kinase II association domain n=1 Tax=Popillia japonica TaxID=7064 RepID=A0AAW1J0Q0_POPJA
MKGISLHSEMTNVSEEIYKYEMKTNKRHEVISMTERIIESIGAGDFDAYKKLCDANLTAFEPESMGNLIEGIDYHKYAFDNVISKRKHMKIRVINPTVKLLGDDAACIAYIRLTQSMDPDGKVYICQTEETRVWQKKDNKWVNVHVHRSGNDKRNIMI